MIYGMPEVLEKVVIYCRPATIPNQMNNEEYEITFYNPHGYSVTFINVQQLDDLLYLLNEKKFDNIETVCTLNINETRLPDYKSIPVKLSYPKPAWATVHRAPNGMILRLIDLINLNWYMEINPDWLSEKDRKLLGV